MKHQFKLRFQWLFVILLIIELSGLFRTVPHSASASAYGTAYFPGCPASPDENRGAGPLLEWSVTGDIGKVYCAYQRADGSNVLGLPRGEMKQAFDGKNYYQEFEWGNIYWYVSERAAFALFWDILDTYRGREREFGFPITSQIGESIPAEQKDCRAYFDKGYIQCNNVTKKWSRTDRFGSGYHDVPKTRLPFQDRVRFTSGPHGYDYGYQFPVVIPDFLGSGVDFAHRGSEHLNEVGAITSGTVVHATAAGNSFCGGMVAVRSDFSGIVVVYGHTLPYNPEKKIKPGTWVKQGDIVGKAQPCPTKHVHIELRDGTRMCGGAYLDDFQEDYCNLGKPVDWDGITIDGYTIVAFRVGELLSGIYNYDGGALKTNAFDSIKLSPLAQTTYLESNFDYLNSCAFQDRDLDGTPGEVKHTYTWGTWTSKDEAVVSGYPPPGCDEGLFDSGKVVYAEDNLFEELAVGANEDVSGAVDSVYLLNAPAHDDPILDSSNLVRAYPDRFTITSCTEPNCAPAKPTSSTCPSDGRSGVYFYGDKNFAGPCAYATGDVPDFDQTPVGDNNVSSVRAIGSWTIRLYPDKNHKNGPAEEVNHDEADLDSRSMGGKYSSAKVERAGDSGLVKNVRSSTGRSYKLSACGEDDKYYTDRDYTIAGFSQSDYDGLTCIRTANDDKANDDKNMVEFDLKQPARIYLYVDRRTTTPPNWMQGLWTANGKQVEVTDGDMDHFNVFSCDSQPGHIILGGPKASGAVGGKSNYVVAFREIDSADTLCTAPQEDPCPAPTLAQPANDFISHSRTIAFDWDDLSCAHTGYQLRIKTVADMERGGQTVLDAKMSDSTHTASLDPAWDNQDLYWSVRAASAPGGASWSPSRRFHITPNDPPTLMLDQANDQPVTANGQDIWSNVLDWSFAGVAADSDGTVTRVEFNCSGYSCLDTSLPVTGTATWTYARNDLAGRNRIAFFAIDDKNDHSNTTDRHSVILWVDVAAPITRAALNGEGDASKWPEWFTEPVEVMLAAVDEGTGAGEDMARSGVQTLHYRLDGGDWQTVAAGQAAVNVSADGEHTVEYYALDRVGNQEETQSVSFRIDRTPPPSPAGVAESHGAGSDVWQKAQNTPDFTWDEAIDPAPGSGQASGLWGYQFYFGPEPDGIAFDTILAEETRSYTPLPGGVRTGTYYLRGRSRDNAGNWSAWTDLFTFRYDGAPPENPGSATHAGDVENDVWQKESNQAAFTWPAATDEGSGIGGYYVYWGSDPAGVSTEFTTATSFDGAPLCAGDSACTGYLRLRSVDRVGNEAGEWTTAFILRYDNAPPTVDFTFNGGATETTQTQVTLHIDGSDAGSGVREMQLSYDGQTWLPWEVYGDRRPWLLPAIGRRSWPVHLRVRDGVGLESGAVMREVYLEVNPRQPRSDNFRLFDHVLSAGAESQISALYQVHSTVGQVVEAGTPNSLHFMIFGGYEAGSQALPIVEPVHDEFTYINGIAGSGVVTSAMTSPDFQMVGTLGEPGLPDNTTTLSSSQFQHQPGFLAAAPAPEAPPIPTPGPTPTPAPESACDFASVTINNGAAFTRYASVSLQLCSPNAAEMRLSHEETFAGAGWEPYAESRSWTLDVAGQQVLPRFVYVQFKDIAGVVNGAYFDDIIYDPNAPEGEINVGDSVPGQIGTLSAQAAGVIETARPQVEGITYVGSIDGEELAAPLPLLEAQSDGTVSLFINAKDDNSGLTQMQISENGSFAGAGWEPFSPVAAWAPDDDGATTLFVRFQDSAGNISGVSAASFVVDTTAPAGGTALGQHVIGPGTNYVLVYLGGEDNLTDITDFRISSDLAFGDAPWQAYTDYALWPVSLTGAPETTVYVQYRDGAGNLSSVYSDSYLEDTEPPSMNVQVDASETMTHTVNVYAFDTLSELSTIYMSSDPLMQQDVMILPYTDVVEWTFDARETVWVQVADSVGNISAPSPAYAGAAEAPPDPLAPAVEIAATSEGLQMTWQHEQANTRYDIWKGSTPDFGPDSEGAERLGEVIALPGRASFTYTDTAGASPDDAYYFVRAFNEDGQVTTEHINVGQLNTPVGRSWSLVTPALMKPLMPTAEDVLASINGAGGQAMEIARWRNGGWDGHVYGLPFSNFPLEPGQSYFIRIESGAVWPQLGSVPLQPTPIALAVGWNLAGFPKLPAPLTAEDVLTGIEAQGGLCSEIDSWDSALSAWVSHPKGIPINNFEIKRDSGYFLKCSQPATYVPALPAAQAQMAAPAAVATSPGEPVANPQILDTQITNRRDVALTLTWRTDQPSSGWVEYGAGETLDQIAHDERGEGAVSTLHHVTLIGLTPQTVYAFRIRSGQSIADADGKPFRVTTLPTGTPGLPFTAYGQVRDAAGQPAAGALVTGHLLAEGGEGSEPLSALVDGWGYWALSLPEPADCGAAELVLDVTGLQGERAQITLPACTAQPAPMLQLQQAIVIPIYLPVVLQGIH